MHYKAAVSALHEASKKFDKYSNRQCEFSVVISGAVASGAGQIYWSCLIALNDSRIQYLEDILNAMAPLS